MGDSDDVPVNIIVVGGLAIVILAGTESDECDGRITLVGGEAVITLNWISSGPGTPVSTIEVGGDARVTLGESSPEEE